MTSKSNKLLNDVNVMEEQLQIIEKKARSGNFYVDLELTSSVRTAWKKLGFSVTPKNPKAFKRNRSGKCRISWERPTRKYASEFYKIATKNSVLKSYFECY